MDRDISFLSDVQQEVILTLGSLFPNFSGDALIDAVTSEINYCPETENSVPQLLNSCMDDLANREPALDLTGMFPPDPCDITSLPNDEGAGGSVTNSHPPQTTNSTISMMPIDEGTGGSLTISQTNSTISTMPIDEGTGGSVNISQTNSTISTMPKDEGTGGSVTISQHAPSSSGNLRYLDINQKEVVDNPNHKMRHGDVDNNNVVVDLEEFEDVSEEVIVVPDGSDCSSSPPEVTFVSDEDKISDFQNTKTEEVELREANLTGTLVKGIEEVCGDSMDTSKRIDADDTVVSSVLRNRSDISSSDPSIVPRDTEQPINGVSSRKMYSSKAAEPNSSFKSCDFAVYTSHSSKSFNSAVSINDDKSTFPPKSPSLTNQKLSDSAVPGPSTSLSGLSKPLLDPTDGNLSSQSIGFNDREKNKVKKCDHTKYSSQNVDVKSQKDVTCASSNVNQVLTPIKPPVFQYTSKKWSEYRTSEEEKSPPTINPLPMSSSTPLSSHLVAKNYTSSLKSPLCRVHYGFRCNCLGDGPVIDSSKFTLVGHQSALSGSSQTHRLSQFKQKDHEVDKHIAAASSHDRIIAESKGHIVISKSKRIKTAVHSGVGETSATTGLAKMKGKHPVKGRFHCAGRTEAHVHQMNRSQMGMSTTDTMIGNSTNVGFAHSSKNTPSVSNASIHAETLLEHPRPQNDLSATHKMAMAYKMAKDDPNIKKTVQNLVTLDKVAPKVTDISAYSLNEIVAPMVDTDTPGTSNGLNYDFKTFKRLQTVKELLDSSKSGTFIKPESSATFQAFVPRNITLAQRSISHTPDDRLPGLPNDFIGVWEEVKTNSTTACACQRKGQPCSCPFPGAGTLPETNKNDPTEMLARVINMFPDASIDFVRQKLETAASSYPDPVQWLCNLMIEEAYPKKPPVTVTKPVKENKIGKSFLSDWRELPRPRLYLSHTYYKQTREVLASVYKLISMSSIDDVMKHTNCRLSPALYVFDQVLESKEFKEADKIQQMNSRASMSMLSLTVDLPGEKKDLANGKKKETRLFRIKFNKKARTFVPPVTDKEILQEISDYTSFQKGRQLESDHQLALDINQKEYDQHQQGIECECCYSEHPFENMVQCFEMHLFCRDCLQRYVNEAIYGQGKDSLSCMAADCNSTFPRDQLEKTLVPDVLAKYDERCSEESVHKADLANLVRCPNCDYAAILALELKAFQCLQCGRETCRDCKVDWMEHFGKKCKEVENDKSEEEMRTKYEEKLTEALIRTCHRCKASIVKENGCNKVTCRCGAKMCYICRKEDIDYNHFCQHVRNPNVKGCTQCKACSLWEVAEVVDEKNMTGIKDELKKEQDEKGIDVNKRAVGVPDDLSAVPSKKPRLM